LALKTAGDFPTLFTPSPIMASFSWSITDESTIRQIKSAKVARSFQSQTFTAFGHQWFLKLYPSGSGKEIPGTQLFLYVAALSPKVKSLRIRRKLCFKDVSREYIYRNNTLTHDRMYANSWIMFSGCYIKLSDIQKLDRLTLTVDFDLIGALDQDNNSILGQFKDNGAELNKRFIYESIVNRFKDKPTSAMTPMNAPTLQRINRSIHGINVFAAAVTWRITDETFLKQIKCARMPSVSNPMGSAFFSPIFEAFGHKWYLKFCPNGSNDHHGSALIFLHTTALSPKIKAMRVCRKLTFLEGGISQIHAETLTPAKNDIGSWAGIAAPKTSDLAEHNELTFRVEFDLHGVFDEHGNDIRNHFIDDDEKQLNISVANLCQGINTYRATCNFSKSELQRIKAGHSFRTDAFTAFGHKWYLKLYPNGKSAKSEGSLFFYLKAVDVHHKLKSLLVRHCQRFVEGDAGNHEITHIDKDKKSTNSWRCDTVKYSDVVDLDMDQLAFIVDFEIIEAVDHDGNNVPLEWFTAEDKLITAAQEEKDSMRKQLEMEQKANAEVDRDIPESFLCPITHRVMCDPVIAFDGRSYEREAIEEYLKKHNKSPVTGAEASATVVFPNHELKWRIIEFIEAQEMASEEQQSKEGEGETTFE